MSGGGTKKCVPNFVGKFSLKEGQGDADCENVNWIEVFRR
jgi:hypothetical protein